MFLNFFPPEAKHCPVTSDCRALISRVGSQCHKIILRQFFNENDQHQNDQCVCCYVCIKSHAEGGCFSCKEFIDTYFPPKNSVKLSKSVYSELRCALLELFAAMAVKELKVESDLVLNLMNFINDFIKVIDEVKTASDIGRIWHVSPDVADRVFSVLHDVLYGDEDLCDSAGSSTDESEDIFDEDSDSTDDDDTERFMSLNIDDNS